jgi:Ca-activated chloride channel homolog
VRCRFPSLLVSLTFASAVVAGQGPTFRSAANGVRVDVLVTDRNRPVQNLVANDFEVLDNGVPQRIESLGQTEPLDLFFTFERSGSIKGQTLVRLKDAARAVLDQLDPSDRAALLAFDQSFLLSAPLTADQSTLRQAIDGLVAGGGTAVLDALYASLTLAEGRTRRTLILLFSDGLDNQSWLSQREVLAVARESDAIVYAIAHKPLGSAGPDEALLKELVEATGGRVVWVEATERLKSVFLAMLQEMRSRYLLTYSPSGVETGGWHTLTVRLKNKAGRVIARRGYVAQPGASR